MTTEDRRRPSVLMRPDEIMSLQRAAHHARQSESTIRRWCKDYGISRKPTPRSPHQISAPALEMVLSGDHDALEKLRAGDRDAPEVQRYLRHLGLKD